ncbi:putative Glyco_trans_2-like domain-containing protein [Candidatus Methylocalor cossyra]|uniref:Glyco_trans_2-like domain-containing protein n=2 Tax=Candidatus Methylocalor cossyra TaxID=3108543 RepID=A0ABM9NEL2_9GAMM
MPVYNTERYLAGAIESILSQTFANFEFVIVDDGSTDGSSAILHHYAAMDARIRLVRQPNRGVAAATNHGLRLAACELVALMDSDDLALPERLAVQKAFLDAHPQWAAVGSQWLMIDAEDRILGLDLHATEPGVAEDLLFSYQALHNPTVMFRKSAFWAVGGYAEDRSMVVQDYDLFMRLRLAGQRLGNVPQVLYRWRLNPHGITMGKSRAQTLSAHAVRRDGFARYLARDPDAARATARRLVTRFPAGTWFDDKLNAEVPDLQDDFLLAAAYGETGASRSEALEHRVLRWLRNHDREPSALIQCLRDNGLPWFAELLAAQTGGPPVVSGADGSAFAAGESGCPLTFLLPFGDDHADLRERLRTLAPCPGAEVILFPVQGQRLPPIDSGALPPSLRLKALSEVPEDDAWATALASASGEYLGYLEEGFRFDPEVLGRALSLIGREGHDIVFVPLDIYYREALDHCGNPHRDPAPEPRWTPWTLLRRDRFKLTGFIHRRACLKELTVPLRECAATAPLALAMYLARRPGIHILNGRHRQFIPRLGFANQVLAVFKERLLQWYFDSGNGRLPLRAYWDRLPEARVAAIQAALDEEWRTGRFTVYWNNRLEIIEFLLRNAAIPWRWSLFRELARRYPSDMKAILTAHRRYLSAWVLRGYLLIARIVARVWAR